MSKYPLYGPPTTDEQIAQNEAAWAAFRAAHPDITASYGYSQLWCLGCGKGHIIADPYWPPDAMRRFNVETCSRCNPTIKDWVPPEKVVSPE